MKMAYNMLIVDDRGPIRQLVEVNLMASYPGIKISKASNGLEALEIISANPKLIGSGEGIDGCLTGIDILGLDGLEFVAKAKVISPGTKYVAMSEDANNAVYRAKAAQLGIEILKKPFSTDSLLELAANTFQLQKS